MDTRLETIVREAADRFERNLEAALPKTTPMLRRWLKRVPWRPDVVEVCLRVKSFPAFHLPFWVTPPAERDTDRAFHVDIAYSTLNGYYLVRLIDNVSDGDGPPELRKLLPALGYFYSQFQGPYQRYFQPDHPFWETFQNAWSEQSEAAAAEAFLDDITFDDYCATSARKFSAAKGPLAAALHRYGRTDEAAAWFSFVDRLGAFAQMVNDLFDWLHDSRFGINTYFLSEYRRRANPGEPLPVWVAREGFDRASGQLRERIDELVPDAARIASQDALAWIEKRRTALDGQLANGQRALRAATSFAAALA